MPPFERLKLEIVLDTRGVKRTRKKVYNEYLVKWKVLPHEDVFWMNDEDIKKHGLLFKNFSQVDLDIFARQVYGVGEPWSL